VLSRAFADLGARQARRDERVVVPDRRDHDALGFVGIDFARPTTRYDAGRGPLIAFPYQLYVDGLSHKSGVARVRVNIEKTSVSVE
jgi:hypothetical protein